jgi:hypothetical protein
MLSIKRDLCGIPIRCLVNCNSFFALIEAQSTPLDGARLLNILCETLSELGKIEKSQGYLPQSKLMVSKNKKLAIHN